MTDFTCHLWTKTDLTREDLQNSLEDVKSYQDESHLLRALKKCKICGQLFFYEFLEEVDWVNGNDPQYQTWVPVADEQNADQINALNYLEIHKFPRIIYDWPGNLENPPLPKKVN